MFSLTCAAARRYLSEFDTPYPTRLDSTGWFRGELELIDTPAVVLFAEDRPGHVIYPTQSALSDADLDRALLDAREQLDRLGDRLPEGAERPVVPRVDPSERPIMMLALREAENGRDPPLLGAARSTCAETEGAIAPGRSHKSLPRELAWRSFRWLEPFKKRGGQWF